MIYREEKGRTTQSKQSYVDGIERIIERRQREAQLERNEYVKDIFRDGERYRRELREMLGWPLTDYECKTPPRVREEKLADETTHEIYRVTVEVLDGLELTGLFFKVRTEEKRPLVIVQHGGQGTPEHISGMYGSTTNYNDMLERVTRHGVHVFAPQLLLWSDEYGVSFDRKAIDARLKRVGSSITAIEVYAIMRVLDYYESKEYVSRFGMLGLSYGGFYTLCTTAIDTRIVSAVSCSFFNTRDAVPWSDWTWQSSAYKFDDAEVACLVYPRRLCIEIGKGDPLFVCDKGIASFERVRELCGEVDPDWIELRVFDGVHEFSRDDEPIEKMVASII